MINDTIHLSLQALNFAQWVYPGLSGFSDKPFSKSW